MTERHKYVSRGSVVFRAILQGKKQGTAEFSRFVRKGSDLVSRWSVGNRKPVPRDRALLEDVVGIPWRWWDDLLEDETDDESWLATEEARAIIARPFPGEHAHAGAPNAA